MQEIKIIKKEDVKFDFTDGYAETEILSDTCPGIRICKCCLKSGNTIEIETYAEEDRMQLLFFTSRSGIVRSDKKIYSIDDQAVFIPDFDREKVAVTAADKDLNFIRITGPMTEIDHRQMKNCQYILPRFVRLKESIEYTERFTVLLPEGIWGDIRWAGISGRVLILSGSIHTRRWSSGIL